MEPRLDGVFRNAQDLGGFGDTELLDRAENEDRAKRFRQSFDDLFQELPELAIARVFFGDSVSES